VNKLLYPNKCENRTITDRVIVNKGGILWECVQLIQYCMYNVETTATATGNLNQEISQQQKISFWIQMCTEDLVAYMKCEYFK